MRQAWWLLSGVLCSCGGTNDYLGAAITAGAGVAAAGVYRTATDGCWADCRPGQECDEISGQCVQSPCDAECPADYRCVWKEGRQQCVLPHQEGGDTLREVAGARKTSKRPNPWLCLLAGVTDCPEPSNPLEPDALPEVDVITGADPPLRPRTEAPPRGGNVDALHPLTFVPER